MSKTCKMSTLSKCENVGLPFVIIKYLVLRGLHISYVLLGPILVLDQFKNPDWSQDHAGPIKTSPKWSSPGPSQIRIKDQTRLDFKTLSTLGLCFWYQTFSDNQIFLDLQDFCQVADEHSEKIASTEAPEHSDQHEIPLVVPTSTTTSFLALVGFDPVWPEKSCDRCWRAGNICLVKKGMACLNCCNKKMKCTLTDKLHGKSQVQSKESWSSSCWPWFPSRVPSEVVPPVTPRPVKCRRLLSTNLTPGPSKVKAGADDGWSWKSKYWLCDSFCLDITKQLLKYILITHLGCQHPNPRMSVLHSPLQPPWPTLLPPHLVWRHLAWLMETCWRTRYPVWRTWQRWSRILTRIFSSSSMIMQGWRWSWSRTRKSLSHSRLWWKLSGSNSSWLPQHFVTHQSLLLSLDWVTQSHLSLPQCIHLLLLLSSTMVPCHHQFRLSWPPITLSYQSYSGVGCRWSQLVGTCSSPSMSHGHHQHTSQHHWQARWYTGDGPVPCTHRHQFGPRWTS